MSAQQIETEAITPNEILPAEEIPPGVLRCDMSMPVKGFERGDWPSKKART